MPDTPKPPEGYESWLEYAMDNLDIYGDGDPLLQRSDISRDMVGSYIRAELSALRTERNRYRKALDEIMNVRHSGGLPDIGALYRIASQALEAQ